jgi:hypothetical protein
MGQRISEATFIYLGMTKDKWPCLTTETIQGFIDEPKWLDDAENEDFVECFYKYFEWYWRDNV